MKDYKDYGFTESKPTSAPYLEPNTIGLLDKNENKTILDLGCGNGWLAMAMIEKGFDVYGIDASPSGIGVAKKKFPDRFFLQDLRSEDLPKEISDIKFDTIVSTEVIEHLYDPIQFLEFCAKILRKSGGSYVVLSTPYHGFLKNLMISLFNGWDKHFMALQKGEHIKFWSSKTLGQALEQTGFEVIGFKGAGRAPFLWKSMIIKAKLKK